MGEEDAWKSEAKFNAFCSEFQSVLTQFKFNEWADIPKWLARVDKVLNKYPQYPYIPDKVVFSKRLAQCLDTQGLPAGVHLRTLETYDLVFTRLQPSRLSRDLPYYSTGLFPLFPSAATNVRPVLLKLYERHYLPLGPSLFPCLSGLVLSILPGIEEASEFMEPCRSLLNKIRDATDPTYFHKAIWRAALSVPSARLPTVLYLTSALPKPLEQNTWDLYLPERNSLVVQALILGLQDSNVLVQRGLLELLVNNFPLSLEIFQGPPLVTLVRAASLAFLRREIGLTRRLHTWLADASPSLLVDALIAGFNATPRDVSSATRPAKILMCLLDKPKIGAPLVEAILPHVLHHMYKHSRPGHEGPFAKEIAKTSIAMLDYLEPRVVWNHLLKTAVDHIASPQFPQDPLNPDYPGLHLFTALIQLLPLHKLPVQADFLPRAVHSILDSAATSIEAGNPISHLRPVLTFVRTALPRIAPDATALKAAPAWESKLTAHMTKAVEVFEALILDVISIAGSATDKGDSEASAESADVLSSTCQVLMALLTHDAVGAASADPAAFQLPKWVQLLLDTATKIEDPGPVFVAIRTFLELTRAPRVPGLDPARVAALLRPGSQVASDLAAKLWSYLSPSSPSTHYGAVQLMLLLLEVAPHAASNIIAEALTAPATADRVEGYHRFSTLWVLSGDMSSTNSSFASGLFLMLDSLKDSDPIIRLVGSTWLADSLPKLDRILDHLLLVLLDPSTRRHNNTYRTVYDVRRILYALDTLETLANHAPHGFMRIATEKPIPGELRTAYDQDTTDDGTPVGSPTSPGNPGMVHLGSMTPTATSPSSPSPPELADLPDVGPTPSAPLAHYLELIVMTASRFLTGDVPFFAQPEFAEQNGTVQVRAAEFLDSLLWHIPNAIEAGRLVFQIQAAVLKKLGEAVARERSDLQVHLLALCTTLLRVGDGYRRTLAVDSESAAALPWEPLTASPAFLPILLKGIKTASQQTLPQWLGFASSSLPFSHDRFPNIVAAITETLCTQVHITTSGQGGTSDSSDLTHPGNSSASWFDFPAGPTKDILLFFKALEGIFVYTVISGDITALDAAPGLRKISGPSGKRTSMASKSNRGPTAKSPTGTSKPSPAAPNGPGLFGLRALGDLVKDVFVSERVGPAEVTVDTAQAAKATLFTDLPQVFSAVATAWGRPKSVSAMQTGVKVESTGATPMTVDALHNKLATQAAALDLLEPLSQHHPVPFAEALLRAWESSLRHESGADLRAVYIEILNTLESATPDVIIHSLHLILSQAVLPPTRAAARAGQRHTFFVPANASKQKEFTKLSESVVLHLLDTFLGQCALPEQLLDAWPHFLAICKEVLAQSKTLTSSLMLVGLLDKYIKRGPSFGDDSYKKKRKELQDVVTRLLETVAPIAGGVAKKMELITGAPTSGLHPASTATSPNSSPRASSSNSPAVSATTTRSGGSGGSGGDGSTSGDHTAPPRPSFLATIGGAVGAGPAAPAVRSSISLQAVKIMPVLGQLLDGVWTDEKDRVTALLTTALPPILQHLRSHDLAHLPWSKATTALLSSLCAYPYTHRAWKRDVTELFLAPTFFQMDPDSLPHWRRIIGLMMMMEKTAFADVIGRNMAKPPGESLFVNMELELAHWSRMLKRLTFCIYAGEYGYYAKWLNAIKRKLVDTLKIPDATSCYVQVFNCLRVLILRIAPSMLASFWPVVLSELMRIFTDAGHGVGDPSLVLAALKFLDLAFCVLPSAMAPYQWIFVVDALDAPRESGSDTSRFVPFTELASRSEVGMVIPDQDLEFDSSKPRRRPIVLQRSMSSLEELRPLLSSLSQRAYEASVNCAPPDWEFIDHQLQLDFLEDGFVEETDTGIPVILDSFQSSSPSVSQLRTGVTGVNGVNGGITVAGDDVGSDAPPGAEGDAASQHSSPPSVVVLGPSGDNAYQLLHDLEREAESIISAALADIDAAGTGEESSGATTAGGDGGATNKPRGASEAVLRVHVADR